MHFHTPPDYSKCSFVCFYFSGVGMDCSIESSDEHFKGDEFLEQLRHTAQVSCMVGGFFDRQLKTLRGVRTAIGPDGPASAPSDLVRQLTVRAMALQALQDPEPRASDPPRFPVFFRQGNQVVALGRPVGRLIPVVACLRPENSHPDLQRLLHMGLAHLSNDLKRQVLDRPVWPEGLAEATLKLLSIGYFVVNSAAEILLDGHGEGQGGDRVWSCAHGRLSLKSEGERAALIRAIREATADPARASIISVSVSDSQVRMVAVAPLEQAGQRLALVLFESGKADDSALREHFFRAYALTRSESLTAQEVLNGRSPTEMAEAMGLTVATVRSYLKQVFAKTGTHRQSELVSLYYSSILPVGTRIAKADARRH